MLIKSISILYLMAFFGFPLIVGFAIVSKRIDLSGLLSDKQFRAPSQVRVQLLLLTIASAAFYSAKTVIASGSGSLCLPDVPESWLVMLGLSNGLYLGGKSASVAAAVLKALKGGSDE
jgi:hypothetical protein